jgi:DNA-binding PadR family transcriptional regulator
MQTKLLVLGTLHDGNFHPYEIKRRLEIALAECYIDVDVGTLYYAIRQLEKESSIIVVARERVARGGLRTVYEITPAGRTEFRKLLHWQFEDDGPVSQTLYGALLFLHLSDLGLVAGLLGRRIARLDELIAYRHAWRLQLPQQIPVGEQYLLDHLDKQGLLDLNWLRSLLADVQARRAATA